MNKRPIAMILLVTLSGILMTASTGTADLRTESMAQDIAGAEATVSLWVSYQGRLLDPGTGQPKPDGAYTMTFSLYNVDGATTPIWIETKSVLVSGGLFSIRLGDTVPLTPGLFNGQALWVGVKIGGDPEMTPRQSITVAPYAAGLVPGAVVTDNSTTATLTVRNSGSAETTTAVYGMSGSPTGIAVGQDVGVKGDARAGYGVAGLSQYSVGGYFESTSYYGLVAKSSAPGTAAVRGINYGNGATAYGVEGLSSYGYAGFFKSNNDQLDLALGGPVGRVNSDPADENSALYLSSNQDLILKLDDDGGENGMLRVKESGGGDLATVDEAGNLTVTGNTTTNKVIYTTAHTGFFSVGGEGFVPGSNVDYVNTYNQGGACIYSGNHALVASVNLPQNATVTAFRVFFNDNSSSDILACICSAESS